ncbi:hypothetical protein HYPSUDRAFT_966312 [Hypholoma sublateritium FD-334 SS-4]|uniref:DUF6534 domain-containing protein n=1 Tax=Hypholoma sublateritium (strain FD-334 SS-4) TaxID=945553 RepID=A0A0D2NNA0_HYPSF|nr:hypothetical protein HYPSUDRAFT_966312 [Hypholoma sublateritium FD-334 SS-4]
MMVFLLWAIDLFQTIITVYMSWIYCVTDYLDPIAIKRVSLWAFTSIPLCNSLSSCITHLFIAHRIYEAAKQKRLAAGALCLSVFLTFSVGFSASLSGIIWHLSMIDVATPANVDSEDFPYHPLMLAWFATRLLVEAVLLASLSCLFVHQGTDFMDDYPSRIVKTGLLAIQCGALTTLFSFLSLVTLVSDPKTTLYIVFLLPSGRLYSNVVLTSINARARRVDPLQIANPTQALTKDIWAAAQATNVQTFDLTQMRTERVEGMESKCALDANSTAVLDEHTAKSHKHSNTQP